MSSDMVQITSGVLSEQPSRFLFTLSSAAKKQYSQDHVSVEASTARKP